VIEESCQIGFWSATSEGKANDKSLADLEGYRLPSGSYLYQDMGFQGFVLAGGTIVQPKKKPRGGELTPLRKRPIVVFPPSESGLNTPLGG
jgi:hypothetical protein